MFASPGFWVTFTTSDAPSTLLVFACVDATNEGLKGRFLQPAAANGLDTLAIFGASLEPIGCSPLIVALTRRASQLVGLNMKLGRLTVTFTVFSRNGTPSLICGSGSLVTVIWPVLGSMRIAERTTSSPRSNGPALSGTTTDRPKGAPLYAPVRYTGPESQNGCEPAPAATVAVPICEADGHCPSCACGSPQSGTPAILPSSPGGVVTVIPPRSCSPSLRENWTANGVLPPASVASL